MQLVDCSEGQFGHKVGKKKTLEGLSRKGAQQSKELQREADEKKGFSKNQVYCRTGSMEKEPVGHLTEDITGQTVELNTGQIQKDMRGCRETLVFRMIEYENLDHMKTICGVCTPFYPALAADG